MMTDSNMTCEAFDAALPDYLEGTLDGSVRASVERHLRECVRCTSLVRDLENITTEAGSLPDIAPSRDLWAGIDARIAAPVIALGGAPAKQRRLVPAWMGIAAAALIVSTAGITYTLTARSIRDNAVAVNPVTIPTPSNAPNPNVATPLPEPAGSSDGGSPVSSGVSRLAQNPSVPTSRHGVQASLASRTQPAVIPADGVYGQQIALLQKIVGQRKSQLDPSTVAIIERNLQIIDAAIEQSRAALSRDPASRMLSQQLNHALDNKVELLRTAAMLPAST
jgi:anti-sigma factor RsiW